MNSKDFQNITREILLETKILKNNIQYDSDLGKTIKQRVNKYFESKNNKFRARGGRNEKIIVYSKLIILIIFALLTKYKQLKYKK